ncbi:O-acetylhomoserine aminocarboxypropyltransferase [Sneathiella sp. HT1-7]|jgi:O-acetylhomoserine (thiol)-lyase|uniref:O-acetylhomoserine aminocarboxypropyltransferase n=1 Tax=Sneathiella sp. HT1-7 TaxID=2887192 RepID=UPI001D15B6D3|nr:O-acetylhomoserine aminocarboxypropyltransferase [Sneathiella sp. HT1-7]MCC3304789.1 O-acetylhomoserine aminocarboxypropyltransferase [Sneathiella sp. HT1-7]
MSTPKFETLSIHAGATPDPTTGARVTPIYQTSGFVFDDADHAAELFNLQAFGNIYSRLTNPTNAVLEERVATLEGGATGLAVSSGHAAQLIVFHTLMQPGDEFLASTRLYGGSITQFGQSFKKFDWNAIFVDPKDPEDFKKALTPKCKAIFIESLANPGGVMTDIDAIAKIAHDAGIPLIVDNTLATPYHCRPIEWGADIVVHSATKFLCGHGNSMGGIIVDSGKFDWSASDNFPTLSQPNDSYHGLKFHETFGQLGFGIACRALGLRDLGPALSPFNAFMILTGIETLPLRMERHSENALKVAEYLQKHDKVSWVSYAGLKGDPYFELGQKYLNGGAGAVLTFGIKGGYDAGVKVVESVELFSHLANIGDTRSLIIHPSSTTHRQLTEEQQVAAGAGPDVVRLSIGIENVDDIIADLEQAISAS